MAEKKLSKKALNKSFRNWFYGHLTCFSQEHMQTFGYLCAMLPLVEELYDTREEQTEALKTYSAFFNTEPQLGTVIVGMTAGLEEAKANGEDIDGEMINGIRYRRQPARRHAHPDSAGRCARHVLGRLAARRDLLHHCVQRYPDPRHAPAVLQGL